MPILKTKLLISSITYSNVENFVNKLTLCCNGLILNIYREIRFVILVNIYNFAPNLILE